MKTLPFMKTIQDAVAVCEKDQDNFYLTAFMLQAWVGRLINDCMAEYAEKKNPRDRALQTGQAWKFFLEIFGQAGDDEFPAFFGHVCRFAEYDGDSMAQRVMDAYTPLYIEHDVTGEYLGPKNRPAINSQLSTINYSIHSQMADWPASRPLFLSLAPAADAQTS